MLKDKIIEILKSKVQKAIPNKMYWFKPNVFEELTNQILNKIAKELEEAKIKESKHSGHTNDDSYCSVCEESVESINEFSDYRHNDAIDIAIKKVIN